MRPRHPAQPDLHPRQAAQRLGVDRGRRERFGQRGHVPRAAHHGDPFVPVGDRPADHLAHVRLALGLAQCRRRAPAADRGHRLGHRIERRRAVAAVLDDVVPPALGVGIAGGRGQRGQRIAQLAIDNVQLFVVVTGRGERLLHAAGRSPAPRRRVAGPT